jgi:hypothetical protein
MLFYNATKVWSQYKSIFFRKSTYYIITFQDQPLNSVSVTSIKKIRHGLIIDSRTLEDTQIYYV